MPLVLLRAHGAEPLGAVEDDLGDIGVGFYVVQDGGLAEQALHRRKRRTGTGLAALALDGGHQSGFLAAHKSAGAQTELDIKIKAGIEDILAQQAVFTGLVDSDLQTLYSDGILGADVNVALGGADGIAGDGHGLQHAVGIALQNGTVHERARVAFVGVAAHIFLVGLVGGGQAPLHPVGKPAPPRPRRPESLITWMTSSGVISVSTLPSAA